MRTLTTLLRTELREAESRIARELGDLPSSLRLHLHVQRKSPVLESRLFAALVAGAAGGTPHEAIPICVLSGLSWAGVETLGRVGALQLLLHHLGSQAVSPRLRREWSNELERSLLPAESTRCAKPVGLAATRQRYLTTACMTARSAAHARDAVMAVSLQGLTAATSEKWREFGAWFGALMDLAASNVQDSVDGALVRPARVVSPLLFAHTLESTSTHRRHHLLSLAEEAKHDTDARAVLHELVSSRSGVFAYHRDVATLHDQARDRLIQLCTPGPYAERLLSDLDRWRTLAWVRPREVLGSAAQK
ncbi:hypothetical protein [Lentzea sp. NPDC004782]|uniref:hypothetical protein n=1 Tax=Lentzea sp. NPDC004782 TaxID=3154458 RepID=UPI0033A7927C